MLEMMKMSTVNPPINERDINSSHKRNEALIANQFR